MKCPVCNAKKTKVTCTQHKDSFTVRYCRCLTCDVKFKTVERYALPEECRTNSYGFMPVSSHIDEDAIKNIRRLKRNRYSIKRISEKVSIKPEVVDKIVRYRSFTNV